MGAAGFCTHSAGSLALLMNADVEREPARRRLLLLKRPPVNKVDVSKTNLCSLESPIMASSAPGCSIGGLKKVALKDAHWLAVRYESPSKPRCRVFGEANLEFLAGTQFNFALVIAFIKV